MCVCMHVSECVGASVSVCASLFAEFCTNAHLYPCVTRVRVRVWLSQATDLLKRMGVSPELDYLEEAK